jgi:hypothetical protein
LWQEAQRAMARLDRAAAVEVLAQYRRQIDNIDRVDKAFNGWGRVPFGTRMQGIIRPMPVRQSGYAPKVRDMSKRIDSRDELVDAIFLLEQAATRRRNAVPDSAEYRKELREEEGLNRRVMDLARGRNRKPLATR